jgi:hypothetical protein
MGTALDLLAGLTISLAFKLKFPKIREELLPRTGVDALGVNPGPAIDGLNAGASGLKVGPFDKKSKSLLGKEDPLIPTGLKAGAATLRPVPKPSRLGLLLRGTDAFPWLIGLLTVGWKPNPEGAKLPGLKEAAGLNLNSLASTLSFNVEDFEVCLL